MARNEEKAFTLFNKWQTFKQEFHAVSGNRRPLLASHSESLPEIEKTRRDIISKITKNIAAIKNASLGEMKIREMNDEINKLMKQKHYWEIRIRELGGNVPIGKQFYDIEGRELPGAPNYKYYGAAKELPGIKELFLDVDTKEAEEAAGDGEGGKKKKRKLRKDLYATITPDYFGVVKNTTKRIPNPFIDTEDNEDSIFHIAEVEMDQRERDMLKEEQELEEKLLDEYRETHKQLIEENPDNEEQIRQLKELALIPEQFMEFLKQHTSGGGVGMLSADVLASNPLSSTFKIEDLATKKSEVSIPQKLKEDNEKNTGEGFNSGNNQNNIDSAKQSLLAKFDLF